MTRLGRVLVVDDEAHAREDLTDLLYATGRVGQVETAENATEALLMLDERPYDAVFLDIRMPGLDGLQMARILRRFADPPAVVFVAASDQHGVEAFAVEAIDYLLKPVSHERLLASIQRIDRLRGEPFKTVDSGDEPDEPDDLPFVAVEVAGKTVLIERDEVRYVEAEGDYVRFHTYADSYLVRRPLASVASEWAPHGFVRIHRSYVVNLRHVAEISPFFNQTLMVKMKDAAGSRLPVSRRQARELRDRLRLRGGR